MKNIHTLLQSIFENAKYQQIDATENFYLYKNTQYDEYFIISSLLKKEINNYLNSGSEHLIELLKLFEKHKDKDTFEKNTTLILAVELPKLDEINFNQIKNSILEIEEDPYWFKKYCLLFDQYTLECIDKMKGKDIVSYSPSDLSKYVTNIDHFNSFKENNFSKPVYYFLLQLFIKLPFLQLENTTHPFTPLQQQIEKKLTKYELELFRHLKNVDTEKMKILDMNSSLETIASILEYENS